MNMNTHFPRIGKAYVTIHQYFKISLEFFASQHRILIILKMDEHDK